MRTVSSLTFWYAILASAGILSMEGSTSPPDFNDSVCDRDNLEQCLIEEIEYFINLGEKEIELGHDKVILVVGLSGAGKTTLVQFIANETNTLKSVETEPGTFTILDEQQFPNATTLEQAFLPQLVFHEDLSVAYYVCLDFNNNQNVSIQVANMYFIKMIVSQATSVKIIVVASEETLREESKIPLQTLLKAVVGLVKNVNKFEGGISMVTTSSSPGQSSEFTYLRRYATFLHNQGRSLINTWPIKRERESAHKIINYILQPLNSVPKGSERLGYFRIPIEEGYLKDLKLFQQNKKFLINLVNKTKNISSDSKDFGYPLSADSITVVQRMVTSLSGKIINTLGHLDVHVSKALEVKSSMVLTSGYTDIISFAESLKKLKEMIFPDCKNNSITTPLHCIESIEADITSFNITAEDYFEVLRGHSQRLPFFYDAIDQFIDYAQWIMPFSDTHSHLNEIFLTSHLPKRETELMSQFSLLAQNFTDGLKSTLYQITNIFSVELISLNGTLSALIQSDFKKCLTFPELIPSIYTTEIAESINRIGNNIFPGLVEDVNMFGAALDNMRGTAQFTFKIEPSDWIQPFLKIRQEVKNHIDSNISVEIFTKFHAIMLSSLINLEQPLLSKFNSTLDITTKIQGFQEIVKALSSLETSFENGTSNEDFTPKVIFESLIRQFIILRMEAPEKELRSLESQLAVLSTLGSLKWSKENDWHRLFGELLDPFEDELKCNKFLLNLFKDLTKFEVQVEDAILHPWWLSAAQINMDNFDAFWQKGIEADIPIIKSADKENTKKIFSRGNESLERLGNLLDTALSPKSLLCPTPSNGNLYLKAKFVTMSNISTCAKQHPETRSIYVTADYALFVDNDFVGRDINQDSNVNLFIISPSLNVKDSNIIDLSGDKASNKISGGHAGNAFIIAAEKSEGVLKIFADGGNGRNGFQGQAGKDGEMGRDKSYFHDRQHCDAWSDLWGNDETIRIKNLFPNNCNNDTETRCDANRFVEIYGDPGAQGGNGGNGTDAGYGGSKGKVITAVLYTASVSQIVGKDGLPGVVGKGGAGGKGGRYGDTVVRWINTMFKLERVCAEDPSGRSQKMSNDFAPNGTDGYDGQLLEACCKVNFEKALFKQSVENYMGREGEFQQNEFYGTVITSFIDSIKANDQLQGLLRT